ncbi:MAG: hypothetical protein H0T78_11290 [Longispora sp.]|nr:hypothetical protein [Longispora sp. (in: high G+C Gram-positive bacteria)]
MAGTVPPGTLWRVVHQVNDVRPNTLKLLVGLLWGKAVALTGLTGWLIYADLTRDPGSKDLATFITGYTAVYAVILAFVGWAVYHRKKWSRGPALMLELFLPGIGYYMLQAGQPMLGIPTIALGLLGIGLLMAPSTRVELGLLPSGDIH